MNNDELKAIIFRILKEIAPECDPTELLTDENIREALDIDSYGFLQLLISISEETGVEIPEADYAQVFTLGGMLSYLSRYLG
jgi:acyl carrier protein